jgi:hypothetical protein
LPFCSWPIKAPAANTVPWLKLLLCLLLLPLLCLLLLLLLWLDIDIQRAARAVRAPPALNLALLQLADQGPCCH